MHFCIVMLIHFSKYPIMTNPDLHFVYELNNSAIFDKVPSCDVEELLIIPC